MVLFVDIVLTGTWAVVAAAGFFFQMWRENNRAPFPPPAPASSTWPSITRLTIQDPNNPSATETSPLLSS